VYAVPSCTFHVLRGLYYAATFGPLAANTSVQEGEVSGAGQLPGGSESSAVWHQVASTGRPRSTNIFLENHRPRNGPVLVVAACQLIPNRAEIEYLRTLSSPGGGRRRRTGALGARGGKEGGSVRDNVVSSVDVSPHLPLCPSGISTKATFFAADRTDMPDNPQGFRMLESMEPRTNDQKTNSPSLPRRTCALRFNSQR
jgi:hypothetical protein